MTPVRCGGLCRNVLQDMWVILLALDITLAQQMQDAREDICATTAKVQKFLGTARLPFLAGINHLNKVERMNEENLFGCQLSSTRGLSPCVPYLKYQVVNMHLFLCLQDLDKETANGIPLLLQSTALIFFHIQIHLFGQEPQALTGCLAQCPLIQPQKT